MEPPKKQEYNTTRPLSLGWHRGGRKRVTAMGRIGPFATGRRMTGIREGLLSRNRRCLASGYPDPEAKPARADKPPVAGTTMR
jgi:hypothetical protein